MKALYSGVAVLIPCKDEAVTITRVVQGFQEALPGATVYVYDNRSTDNTARLAREAGAVVRTEPVAGKGNVVRRMFADVDADVYVLVDGDGTYAPSSAPDLVKALLEGPLDMVTGARVAEGPTAYRRGHRFGNALLTGLVSAIFRAPIRDMLSGYRAFSRRFVKSFPALATGFEIETELVIHALALRLPTSEVDTPYRERPEGSTSKLSAVRDGATILATILNLTRRERPVAFFGLIGLLAWVTSFVLAYPLVVTFMKTGLVPRFPTAILCTGLVLVGIVSMACGLILDNVSRSTLELRRLAYLQHAPPAPGRLAAARVTAEARVARPVLPAEDPAAPDPSSGPPSGPMVGSRQPPRGARGESA